MVRFRIELYKHSHSQVGRSALADGPLDLLVQRRVDTELEEGGLVHIVGERLANTGSISSTSSTGSTGSISSTGSTSSTSRISGIGSTGWYS